MKSFLPRKNLNRLVLYFFSFLIASCSSQNQVPTYHYPEDDNLQNTNCFTKCSEQRASCDQLQYRRYQECKQFADRRYKHCQRRRTLSIRTRRSRSPLFCSRSPCFLTGATCIKKYDLCFINCGGEVHIADSK